MNEYCCDELKKGIEEKVYKIVKGILYSKPIMGIKTSIWLREEECPWCGKYYPLSIKERWIEKETPR